MYFSAFPEEKDIICMLRSEEYLVKYGTINISYYSLPRVWNLEKVRAVENIGLVKIPESHHSKFGNILLP